VFCLFYLAHVWLTFFCSTAEFRYALVLHAVNKSCKMFESQINVYVIKQSGYGYRIELIHGAIQNVCNRDVR